MISEDQIDNASLFLTFCMRCLGLNMFLFLIIIDLEELFVAMKSPQQSFKTDYNALLRGINRIRFIKKKQAQNHTQLANTITKIVQTLNPQPQQSPSPPHTSLMRNLTSRGKFKIAPLMKKYQALQPTQDQSSIAKGSQHHEHSTISQSNFFANNHSIRNCSTDNLKFRQIQESKWSNYKEMKQLQRQFQKRKKHSQQQSLKALRSKVMKITKQKQQGKKKIENNYFQYIQQVHLNKQQDKQRRARMTEKKHREIEILQEKENEQIQIYEATLALEHHLKRVIEQQINAKEEKSTFASLDANDPL